MHRSTSFVVAGLEPSTDPRWRRAHPSGRAAFYRVCRELVLIAFDAQMAAGLDKDGMPFARLSPYTIRHRKSAMGRADPNAPPLIPAHTLSRTRSLVNARIEGTFIRVFWRWDEHTEANWGVILDYHRKGAGHLPIRNVFGLSPLSMASVKAQALAWWRAYSRGLPAVAPLRPIPGRPSRVVTAAVPEYEPKNRALHGSRPSTTHQVSIAGATYTMSSGSLSEVIAAARAGTFSGFKSYK